MRALLACSPACVDFAFPLGYTHFVLDRGAEATSSRVRLSERFGGRGERGLQVHPPKSPPEAESAAVGGQGEDPPTVIRAKTDGALSGSEETRVCLLAVLLLLFLRLHPGMQPAMRHGRLRTDARAGGHRVHHQPRSRPWANTSSTISRALAARTGGRVERCPVERDRFNVFAHWGEPVVTLSTHMDTVPPFFPSREDDEFIWGRGSADAKGIIAAMIGAAERSARSGRAQFRPALRRGRRAQQRRRLRRRARTRAARAT